MAHYLVYLRKSRKDRDIELQTGIFDTLQRHRDALLSLASSSGYTIAGIFEEVVSGDTIAERPEMQRLLSAVETGEYAGVLVMEVPRLARGNTRDQGTVAETFKYSNTKIITPDKIYDPSDEADEEYFEFGLFMSRREYMAINRRLQRGRMASLNEGKYIAGTPPYGYRKKKLEHQKGYTLEVDWEQARVVSEIFRLYTDGEPRPDGTLKPIGSYAIANQLNAQGIPSPGGVKWSAPSVRDVLKNPTYAGYVRWAYRPQTKQMIGGVLTTSYPVSKDCKLQKGLHEAIISEHTWKRARAAMSSRSHAPVPGAKQIANPLAGLLYCSVCGRSLVQLPKGCRGGPMVLCPTPKCPTVGSRRDVVEQALMESLFNWLKSYRVKISGQPDPSEDRCEDLEQALAAAQKNLDRLTVQKSSLYDLLEQGIYTQDIFLERSGVLASRIAEAEAAVQKLRQHLASISEAGQTRRQLIPRIQNVLDVYHTLDNPADQNALLKSVLDHVIYFKSVGGQWKKSDMQLYIFPKIPPFADAPQSDDGSLHKLTP
jgi:DNA invertase Pin-like site-specific DNA recombinase